MNELSANEVIHCECGCVHGELGEVLGLASQVHAQAKLLNTFADGFDEPLDDGALHAAPVRDLVDDGLAILTQHLLGGPHTFAPLGGDLEDVREVRVQREFMRRESLPAELRR